MGEKQNQPFQLSFNASLRIDFQGSWVTSEGGLFLVRELDDCLAAKLRSGNVHSARTGKNRCCLRSSGNRSGARRWCFVPTRLLPNRKSSRCWRRAA